MKRKEKRSSLDCRVAIRYYYICMVGHSMCIIERKTKCVWFLKYLMSHWISHYIVPICNIYFLFLFHFFLFSWRYLKVKRAVSFTKENITWILTPWTVFKTLARRWGWTVIWTSTDYSKQTLATVCQFWITILHNFFPYAHVNAPVLKIRRKIIFSNGFNSLIKFCLNDTKLL